ncbi:MAG: amidohydrolase family protein [Sediminibacterium sp.]|nr:amidohydrolase family protein [Sediminibacterium sp.]
MQKKYLSIFALALLGLTASAQDNVYPAAKQKGVTVITHTTVHIGNGTTLTDASVAFENGKITGVGNVAVPAGATVIDGTGKQVYPGLILPSSDLGLREIGAGVRGSNDYAEIGENNANIRSIVAYNTDSKIIGVLRENGILLAGVAPQGELIEGQSSVVQLDAWNYEDAAYKMDNGLYINLPSLMARRGGRMAFMRPGPAGDPVKAAMDKVETIKTFFADAKAYYQEKTHAANNLKLEAVRGLFEGKQKLFVRANEVKQILIAMDIAKTFGFKLVIVGGTEAYQIADLLAENNVPVILDRQHALPSMEDDDVDQPYKTPAALQKAGVLFCLNDTHDQSRFRNLAFNAGTAATYGLTKEQALSAVTLNPAKILGIEDKTGTIEAGKDANLLIVNGDLLDMKSSVIGQAFIQGRNVSLDNKGKQLYERYKHKYQLK